MSAAYCNNNVIDFLINDAKEFNKLINKAVKLLQNAVILEILCLFERQAVQKFAVIAASCFNNKCVTLEIKRCVGCDIVFIEAVSGVR